MRLHPFLDTLAHKCLFLSVPGVVIDDHFRALISHPCVAGFVLMASHDVGLDKLGRFIAALKKINPTLGIAVDQEGGRVWRLKQGFEPIASMHEFAHYDQDPKVAMAHLYQVLLPYAKQMKDLGIDINFAPVVDLYHQHNQVIANRAFSSDPSVVVSFASTYIAAMEDAGIMPVIKHFPGHGNSLQDSHLQKVKDLRSEKEMLEDMAPFKALIQQNNKRALMSSHVHFSAIDKDIVSYSPYWLKRVLRQEYGFEGRVFSDDLSMAGALEDDLPPMSRIQKALDAGVDYPLMVQEPMSTFMMCE